MKIASVAFSVPSLRITNTDLMQQLEARNAGLPAATVERYSRLLKCTLDRCGSQVRFFRDRERGETALDLTIETAKNALRQSGLRPGQIDLVLYCGVARGFLEPATAYLVCRAMGLHCDCFDILDACMGWVRALHIAYNLLARRAYTRVLIVNGEFNSYEHGYPELLTLGSEENLRYTFPAFTIGEGAAATVITRSRRRWQFRFRSDPSKADLCTLPIAGHADYSGRDNLALNGTNRFMSYGQALSEAALREMVRFIRETYREPDRFDIWFPHAASVSLCRNAVSALGIKARVFTDVLPRFGNLVSVSIPAALALATSENLLQPGTRFVLCPASAGMALALADSVY